MTLPSLSKIMAQRPLSHISIFLSANHRINVLAIPHTGSPSVLLGEERLGVAEEKLCPASVTHRQSTHHHIGKHTISSPLTPLTLPQAFMTHESLLAIQATTSTPLLFSSPIFSIYGGRWRAWQPGVKAPGTENSTTFLPFHSLLASYSWGRPQAVGSESVIGAHLVNHLLARLWD